MIDIETTGTDPSHLAIIQISAVRFNYETMAIDPNIFDICLDVAPGRFWDEGTRDWWHGTPDRAELLQRIQSRGQDPRAAFRAFRDWTWEPGFAGQRMWAKPISFEWPAIQSYATMFGETLPFHFRDAVDLNSFCRGMAGEPGADPLEKTIPFEGEEHNAIDDVMHQIRAALMARVLIPARAA